MKDNVRMFAREAATARDLTVEELKLVAGGSISTGNGMDCEPGTMECMCLADEHDPCCVDYMVSD